MFVKNIATCSQFEANDGCLIQEWLHPKNDPVKLSYSVAMATVDIGQQSYKHKLEQTEVYLISSGEGEMYIDNEVKKVTMGDAIYIEPERTQWIKNCGDEPLRFIAIVNPPWTEKGDQRL